MARKKGRKRGFDVEDPIVRHRPKRGGKPHLAMELFDAGKVAEAWNVVSKLRPWAQRAVIGTTKEAADVRGKSFS